MKTSWTQGLKDHQIEEVCKEYASSPVLRERLKTLLEKKLDASRQYARAKSNYENPSWPYVQADSIGYERAIFEIISLISTKSVE